MPTPLSGPIGSMTPALLISASILPKTSLPRATAACTVRARSAAEMPVVTPSAASIDMVKLVPVRAPLTTVITGTMLTMRITPRTSKTMPVRIMRMMGTAPVP